MKKLTSGFLCVILSLLLLAAGAGASSIELSKAGDAYETAHFTVDAIAVNANSESFNQNPDFSLYTINDYTKAVPYAYSTESNGTASQERKNNCASMYLLMTSQKALLIDLGNGAAATAANFGEDGEDVKVTSAIDQEYFNLISSLVGNRTLEIAITHFHGDHIGYRTAFANVQGLKVYFPKNDYQDKYFGDNVNLELFDSSNCTIDVGDGITVSTIWAGGHSPDSTVFVMNTPQVTYEYGTDGKATGSQATYYVFSGDALGSGAGVWIFSADALTMLAQSVPKVIEKLETYNTYKDYLSDQTGTDAGIRLLGGHAWQKYSRFGEIDLNLDFVRNLETALQLAADGKWVDEGSDTSKEAQTLKDGNLVLFNWGYEHWLGNTLFYGTDPAHVNGVDLSMDTLNVYAGLAAPEATDSKAK